MDTVTLLFVLRAPSGFDDPAVEALSRRDEGLRLWRDDADPTVLRGSIESSADDLDEALARGRELASELVVAGPLQLDVEEVVAMDDEQQLVWRAEP